MKPGDRVSHPQYGVGTVKTLITLRGKAFALVDLGYMDEYLRVDFLELIAPVTAPSPAIQPPERKEPPDLIEPVDPVTTPPSKTQAPEREELPPLRKRPEAVSLSAETVEARRGIVALRLGQILESHVSQISVATKEAEQSLRDSLRQSLNQKPTIIMVEGAWGGGKTHILTLLSVIAKEQKFATSSVVLDGIGITLSDPMLLMESVLSTMRFPQEDLAAGMGKYLRRVDTSRLRVRGAHMLAGALEQVPTEALQEPEVLHILEDYLSLSLPVSHANTKLRKLGWRVRLPALNARYVRDRPARFCELICDWAQFSVAMGTRGLVVVLDEIDVEYATTAWWDQGSRTKRQRRQLFVKEIGRLRKSKVPLLFALGSAPAGPDVEIENDAVRDIESTIGGFDYHIKVPNPTEKDLRALGSNIINLYKQAYQDSSEGLDPLQRKGLLDQLVNDYKKSMSPVPRLFVRTMLESLDVQTT